MMRMRSLAGALLALAVAAPGSAQISVAPTIVFTTQAERFGTFVVNNGSTVAQEVVVEFRFGYPKSDTLGNMGMEYADVDAAARFGVDPWVQAFPRRFVLGPGQHQVVRMAVRTPEDLPEGTYWTRIVTTSTPRSEALDTVADGVAARIVMRLQHVTTLVHRQGASTSGVEVGRASVTNHPEQGQRLVVPLTRTGNTPFLGMLTVEVRDSTGVVVLTAERAVAVYFDAVEHLALERALPQGRYEVTLTLRPGRPDVPPEHVVGGEPVVQQVTLDWP